MEYKSCKARLALKKHWRYAAGWRSMQNKYQFTCRDGSFLRLIAFYTDYVCDENSWQEAVMMKICEKVFFMPPSVARPAAFPMTE